MFLLHLIQVKVFKHMVKTERVDSANIIIMSQYNAQCSRIRLALRKERLFVQNVNTVVASQGSSFYMYSKIYCYK